MANLLKNGQKISKLFETFHNNFTAIVLSNLTFSLNKDYPNGDKSPDSVHEKLKKFKDHANTAAIFRNHEVPLSVTFGNIKNKMHKLNTKKRYQEIDVATKFIKKSQIHLKNPLFNILTTAVCYQFLQET